MVLKGGLIGGILLGKFFLGKEKLEGICQERKAQNLLPEFIRIFLFLIGCSFIFGRPEY